MGLGGWAEVFRCVESCSGWRADLELRASRMSYVSPGWLDGAIDIENSSRGMSRVYACREALAGGS